MSSTTWRDSAARGRCRHGPCAGPVAKRADVRAAALGLDVFGRSLIEDVAAAPKLSGWTLLAMEQTQRQMLAALLGDAVVDMPTMPALAPLLVVVFGLQGMCTRVLLRSLGFLYAVSRSCGCLGDRAKLVVFFNDECDLLTGVRFPVGDGRDAACHPEERAAHYGKRRRAT